MPEPLANRTLKNLRRRMKIYAVRRSSATIKRLALNKPGLSFVRSLRRTPLTAHALNTFCGYNRTFPSLEAAQACASSFLPDGAEHAANAEIHLELAKHARPSDYAALFHINKHKDELKSVFDFGGNVGNLFYCYDRMLSLPKGLKWIVYDLPAMMEIGRKLARDHGENRLVFSDDFQTASGADLLLASGSMHYFEQPLPELISQLPHKPKYVIINRTPLIDSEETFTVQDAGYFLASCKLFNKEKLIQSFAKAGYELVDSWQVLELCLEIPADPEHSAPSYSGLYFQLA